VSRALVVRGLGQRGEEEEGDVCEPKPLLSFIKAHAAFEINKLCLYMHSIGRRVKQNTLNLELALFCLQLVVSA
jgi:hypothetical protein